MPNDHQRFTGINLNGPGQHGQGTWKALCGTANDEIVEIFYQVTNKIPTDIDLGQARWLLGASQWYGEQIRCPTFNDYAAWLLKEHAANPVPPPDHPQNGLRHDWRTATAAWLYPGDPSYWIASHRMMLWDSQKIARYLALPEIAPTTHVMICLNTGKRREVFEKPFDGLRHPDTVREVFQQVIEADKAPIAFCVSQEFFVQALDGIHRKLLEYLEESTRLVADLCHMALPMRELGDIYGGREMDKRNDLFKAMRKGAPNLPLAEHERSLEQIPVSDFRDVGGTIISGLQTGFGTPTGGENRPADQITHGDHTYDGACGFIASNKERMDHYVTSRHILESHVNAVFEHSLPRVYAGQMWKPTRTLAHAQARGKKLLQHGAAFDLSAGVADA